MFRSPSFDPSPSRRALGRNLALDLVAATGVGVSMALVTALLPTIARRGGLEPLGLSALAAAPFVANLLSAFAGRFGPRSPAQLALIRGIGAASLLLVFVVPALMPAAAWLGTFTGRPDASAWFPLFFLAIIMGVGTATGQLFIQLAVIAFAGILLFHVVTLPVEINASTRAYGLLTRYGILSRGEADGTKRVLSAAAFTYIAAALTSLLTLLYLLALSRE